MKYSSGGRIIGTGAERTALNTVTSITNPITSVGSDTVIQLKQSGTFVFTPASTFNIEYLLVAGGGGGKRGSGGGGGAGGLLNVASYQVTNQAYTITIGAGGLGTGNYEWWNYEDGDDSIITPATGSVITSIGGGRGGDSGGSGGGGGASASGPAGTAGQGNAGGDGGSSGAGGGGGGAGTVGVDANGSAGGNGGNGAINDITGSLIYYAAGGGGGAETTQGVGGLGQGSGCGNGSKYFGNNGCGFGNGGGGTKMTNDNSGAGSTGICILRFPSSVSYTCVKGTAGTEPATAVSEQLPFGATYVDYQNGKHYLWNGINSWIEFE